MSTDGPLVKLATYIVCGRCSRPITSPQPQLRDLPRYAGPIWFDACEREAP